MATKKTIIELTTVGGERIKADLNSISEEGRRALQRIADSSKPASAGLQAIDEAAHAARERIHELAGESGVFGNILSKLGPLGLGPAAADGAAGGIGQVGHRAAEGGR